MRQNVATAVRRRSRFAIHRGSEDPAGIIERGATCSSGRSIQEEGWPWRGKVGIIFVEQSEEKVWIEKANVWISGLIARPWA